MSVNTSNMSMLHLLKFVVWLKTVVKRCRELPLLPYVGQGSEPLLSFPLWVDYPEKEMLQKEDKFWDAVGSVRAVSSFKTLMTYGASCFVKREAQPDRTIPRGYGL